MDSRSKRLYYVQAFQIYIYTSIRVFIDLRVNFIAMDIVLVAGQPSKYSATKVTMNYFVG